MKILCLTVLCFFGISHVSSLTCDINKDSDGVYNICHVANQVPKSGEITFNKRGSRSYVSNEDITEVVIINTTITEIPASIFTTFPNIITLNLDNTGIRNWNRGTFKVQGISLLSRLLVKNHPVNRLTKSTFKDVLNLYVLRFNNCSITEISPQAFNHLTKLVHLSLYRNNLTSIESGVFNPFKDLESIDLDDNQITALPNGVFSTLKKLEELDLNNNQLTEIPEDIFKQNIKLKKLIITKNNLKPIDASKFPARLTNLLVGKL